MNNNRKKTITLLAAISAIALTTVVAAVAPGSDSNPLVSLGYLNGAWKTQLKTEINTELDNKIQSSVENAENELGQSLENEIASLKDQLKNDLGDELYSELENDIITKIESLKQDLNNDISSDLTEKLTDEIYAMVLEKLSPSGELSSSNVRFETVTVDAGKELHLSGECEIVMRTGSAILRIESGLASVTRDDTENRYIQNGENISRNHLITVSNGNGDVFVVTQNGTQFMIRGVYTVVG